jgi:hypothetical protein
MPGDGSFSERLLCVAEKVKQTAVSEKKKARRFSEKLLF